MTDLIDYDKTLQLKQHIIDLGNNISFGVTNSLDNLCHLSLEETVLEIIRSFIYNRKRRNKFLSKLPKNIFDSYAICKQIIQIDGSYLQYMPQYNENENLINKALRNNCYAFLHVGPIAKKKYLLNEKVANFFCNDVGVLEPLYYDDYNIMVRAFANCPDDGLENNYLFMSPRLKKNWKMLSTIMSKRNDPILFFSLLNNEQQEKITETIIKYELYGKSKYYLATDIILKEDMARTYWLKIFKCPTNTKFFFVKN